MKRLTSQLAAQEKARATAVLEIQVHPFRRGWLGGALTSVHAPLSQRLTRQARTMSDMRGTSTASTLSGLNEFIASSRDFVRRVLASTAGDAAE